MTAPATLSPDVEAMTAHLDHLFGGDLGGYHEGLVEIAWTEPFGALKHAKLFETSELEEAAEFAAKKNAVKGTNIYAGAALRQPSTPTSKRCSDGDVLALPAYYADLDKPSAHECAEAGYDKLDVKPTCVVVTGRHPHERAQLWWRLRRNLFPNLVPDDQTIRVHPSLLTKESLNHFLTLLGIP